MSKRPGGELATRPLHFIWIADCSGSMEGEKIQSLNAAIAEALPHMREVAHENPYAQVLVRAIKFSNGAQWHVTEPTPVDEFEWKELSAGGVTDLGKAMHMVAEQLKIPPMAKQALPPVLVLVSDGMPTDDYKAGLRALLEQPWGKKAVRMAIAIGRDADHENLQRFISNPELKPLRAHSSDALKAYIKWTSTAVLKAASAPATQIDLNSSGHVSIPKEPDVKGFAEGRW